VARTNYIKQQMR